MFEQILRTRDAGMRLLDAHIALARAELAPIIENVKAVAIQAAVVLAMAIFAGLIVAVGVPLFLGEWIFGSLGWGIVHGVAFAVAVSLGAVWLILRDESLSIVRAAILAVLIGLILGVVFGLNLTNQAWTSIAESLNLAVDAAWRVLAVAVAVSAIAGAILGILIGATRRSGRAVLDGLVAGVILGAIIGGFTAIAFGPQVGAALGVLAAYISLATILGIWLARDGVDTDALTARFYPAQTIETTKETLEWLQDQSPTGPRP